MDHQNLERDPEINCSSVQKKIIPCKVDSFSHKFEIFSSDTFELKHLVEFCINLFVIIVKADWTRAYHLIQFYTCKTLIHSILAEN